MTLYDVGSEAGIDLIVMELVEGATLKDQVGRRPMPLDTLLTYAVQIADALTAALAAGIVHRDLQPTNIMVTAHDFRTVAFLPNGSARALAAGLRNERRPRPELVSAVVCHLAAVDRSGRVAARYLRA